MNPGEFDKNDLETAKAISSLESKLTAHMTQQKEQSGVLFKKVEQLMSSYRLQSVIMQKIQDDHNMCSDAVNKRIDDHLETHGEFELRIKQTISKSSLIIGFGSVAVTSGIAVLFFVDRIGWFS